MELSSERFTSELGICGGIKGGGDEIGCEGETEAGENNLWYGNSCSLNLAESVMNILPDGERHL